MDNLGGEIYKIGTIYKRSKLLKRWNKRSIVLNYIKGTLNLRKGKSAKEKVIVLDDYEVVWVGQPKKTKVFYFSLKAVKNINSHKYKRLHIGDVEEANAKIWMQEIERIVNRKYAPKQDQQQQRTAVQIVEPVEPVRASTVVKFAEKNTYLEVPASAIKSNDVRLSSRQIVSVQKGEDYDEILKQFESCCQYEDDVASEYDEHMPHERAVVIPDFNYMFNISFMPDTILDNPGIDDLANNAPVTIRDEVTQLLEAYYKKPSRFLDQQVNKKMIKENANSIYFDEDQDVHIIHITIPNMTPIEVYEEIQTPSTNEHWNTVIDNYSIQPADLFQESRNLSQLLFNFKYEKADGKIADKQIFAYRYSVQFTNAYFIWEFQDLGIDANKEQAKLVENKIKNTFLIIPDNEQGCHLVIKSNFSFNNEPKEQQVNNLYKFLKNFNLVMKCAETSQDSNIIIECNAEQGDAESQDDIDSGVFISVRIEKSLACGNAEQDFSTSEVDSILTKLVKNDHITECIHSRHEKRIVKGKYEHVPSTKENGHYSFKKDYKRDEKKGGMLYYNEKLMKEQKTVLMSIVKRIGSNLLNGRGIMNISMPVQVFDSKTILQRLARGFGHAPNFLEKAAQTTSVVEQIKLSASFLLASFIMGVGQEKPFNPIIGETMQGRLNGCPIYFEQTSHHPAISHYQLYGRGYDLYGCHIPIVNMSANSLAGQVQGGPTINIKHSNTKIKCIWGSFSLYNIIFGQRYLNMSGRAFIFEEKSNLVLELVYNPNNTKGIGSLFSKRYMIDEVQGSLYRVHPHVIKKLNEAHKPMASKQDLSLDLDKDVLQMISKAEGIWSKYLDFDGVRYWDDDKDFPYMLEYEATPLPSDSKFRPDLLYFLQNNKNESQNQKESMEVDQRQDQKLREVHKKNRNKQ